jgi:hypothetical protein
MKNLDLNIKTLVFILFLSAQVFAQRFTIIEPDVLDVGSVTGVPTPTYTGYYPGLKQIAVLGEKNSNYANLMLLGGRDTSLVDGQESVGTYNVVNSQGNVLGTVRPLSAPNVFITSSGDEIHDNSTTAVVVLDSLNDSKNTATVIFASLRKLIVMRITISSVNNISFSILSSMNMPEFMCEVDGGYIAPQSNRGTVYTRRLALLGTSQNGTDIAYNLATGNPYSKSGTNEKSGRVDFFNITKDTWALFQPNQNGLADGKNGLVLNANTYFGKDLTVIDNFDKKGGKALAVLLPKSTSFPNSALYIFQMDNNWTPSTGQPIVISGSSNPWLEKPEQSQDCGGLGVANWGDETTHLLVACRIYVSSGNDGDISNIIIIKDIILDITGNILNSSILSSTKISAVMPAPVSYNVYSNPIAIKNHKNDLHSISLAVSRNATYNHYQNIAIFTVMDADYSKNFSIEAGKEETIVGIDSLFYKSGTTGFSVKTLSGLVQCEIKSGNLSCLGGEKAIDSWSSIELSSSTDCGPYKICKRKDTIFVYAYSPDKKPSTALRIPKDIILPYYGQVNLDDLKSRSYFKNPDLQKTSTSWKTDRLKLSAVSGSLEKVIITPFSQNEGIDTLIFTLYIGLLTEENYMTRLHVADSSKILYNGIPANPGSDTVWNVGQKKYIALPLQNSNGNIYTYDIVQDSLKNSVYAEIIGDYLHILQPDIADILIAYTENQEIKYRKIHLMPEPSTPIVAGSFMQNLNAIPINGGLQISGLNGEIELRAYNLKGMEIQREKINAKGSVFVKLKQNCPQIVQIKSANEKFYLKVTGQNF